MSFMDKKEKPTKQFVSTAVQTTESLPYKETYDKYLKFTITKKNTFAKVKHLINYLDTLAGL